MTDEPDEKIYEAFIPRSTMEDYIRLMDYCVRNLPFIPFSLRRLNAEFDEFLRDGCFEHNRLCERIHTGEDSTVLICPQCNPKEYSEYKQLEEWEEDDT